MRLLLDEGVPMRTAALLRHAEFDARHVLDLGMGGASDEAILSRAQADAAVVVTLDADFHQMLAATGATAPSVIRVRVEGLGAEQLTALLLDVLNRVRDELPAGAAISVTSNSVRLRKLPLRA